MFFFKYCIAMKLLPLIFYSTELANDESRYQGISGANYIFNNVAGSRNKYKIITSTATEQERLSNSLKHATYVRYYG